jgi:hypothetical protein
MPFVVWEGGFGGSVGRCAVVGAGGFSAVFLFFRSCEMRAGRGLGRRIVEDSSLNCARGRACIFGGGKSAMPGYAKCSVRVRVSVWARIRN